MNLICYTLECQENSIIKTNELIPCKFFQHPVHIVKPIREIALRLDQREEG